MGEKDILILFAEWYLNGILIGYLLYFSITFRYVKFMRSKSMSLIEALGEDPGKRVNIKGLFCGLYPKYNNMTIDYAIKINLTGTRIIVLKDGLLQFSNEVVINGRILHEKGVHQVTRIRAISSTHPQAIKQYMNSKFNKSMYIAYGGSTLWLLLQILVF